MNHHPSNKSWARLVATNPDKKDIYLISHSEELYEGQVKIGCQIYDKSTGDAWIRNLFASSVKIDGDWLEAGEEKEISSGERISFNKDKENDDDEDFDYVFFLMNSHSKNGNKRKREENLELQMIPSNTETAKLSKNSVVLKPCLHTFCGFCILNSLSVSINCPLCRAKGTSVTKNLIVQDLAGFTLESFPEKQRPKEEIEQKSIELEGTIVKCKKKVWTYIGGYQDEKREGEGTIIFSNGKICKGIWVNNVMQKDAEVRTDKRIYVGETDRYEMHGKGVLKWNDGDVYQGDFVRGAQEGFGILKCSNGVSYEGEWKKDKKHGTGVGIFEDGNRYEGSWAKNRCHGKGQFTWTDGQKYDGNWKEGLRDGTGTMKFSDRRVYEGQWKDGDQDGRGVLTLINGDQYEGIWARNVLKSVKKVSYVNGDIYEGEIEFDNLQKHGKGVLTSRNGDKYDGLWKNDKQHGEGIRILKDSQLVFEGVWKEGALVEEFIMTDANGERYKVKKLERE